MENKIKIGNEEVEQGKLKDGVLFIINRKRVFIAMDPLSFFLTLLLYIMLTGVIKQLLFGG